MKKNGVLRASVVLVVALATCVTACSSSAADESTAEVVASTAEDLTINTDPACNLALFYSLSIPEIHRGLEWVGARVMYSPSVTRQSAPYRADCSGFVSMAWDLPAPGASTARLAPYNATYSHAIGWNDLRSGDALNYHHGSHGHAMLFVGWADAEHVDFCTLEEFSTGKPAALIRHSTLSQASKWGGAPGSGTIKHAYVPIRKN